MVNFGFFLNQTSFDEGITKGLTDFDSDYGLNNKITGTDRQQEST